MVAHIQRDYDRAASFASRTVEILRGVADRRGEVTALNLLGLIAHHRGDFGAARAHFLKDGRNSPGA